MNIILIAILSISLLSGAEEITLKEARIDVSIGYYHLANVRLERLLKEYPDSKNRKEILTLIIKSYVLSHRENEAIPHIRTFLHDFPNDAATLDPKYLQLISTLPTSPPVESAPAKIASPAPPEPASEKETSTPVIVNVPENVEAPPKIVIPVPVVEEAKPAYTGAQQPQSTQIGVPTAAAPVVVAPAQLAERPSAETKEAPVPIFNEESKKAKVGSSTTQQAPQIEVAPPGPAPPSVEQQFKGYYTLFAGETVYRSKLSKLLKKLRAAGFQPQVSEGKQSAVMHRLVTGCYPSSRTALKHQRDLAGVSKDAFIFREGDNICVSAGSYKKVEITEQEHKRLAGKGIVTRIAPFNTILPLWSITVGRFSDATTAENALRKLSANGLKLTIRPIKN